MEHVYLGRQPILDDNCNLVAYEVLYREGHQNTAAGSNRYVSASVVNAVLNKFGTDEILGHRKAFVKIDEKFLMNDLIFTIPTDFFIFSIVHVKIDEKIIERFEQLKERGYTLAINDIALNEESIQQYVNVLDTLSYVKIDFDKEFSEDSTVKNTIKAFKNYNIKVVATKIETQEEFNLAKEMGCELFQGYFFAEPQIFENNTYDASQANILKLYSLLMDDTNIDELTTEFEKNHEITLQLIRYINSGAFHFRKKISSIHHILTLVGRIPLAQWLMLMIYSKAVAKGQKVSPLMLMIKNRTEIMEYALKKIEPGARSNLLGQAYFVGVLSLIDSVFDEKLEVILTDMNVDEAVKDALLHHKGMLGDIYRLVKDIETFNTHGIERFVKKYDLKKEMVEQFSLRAMEAVTAFEKSMNSI
jgi:EAL and modified HD-GYP domain-containing signal transduction protein